MQGEIGTPSKENLKGNSNQPEISEYRILTYININLFTRDPYTLLLESRITNISYKRDGVDGSGRPWPDITLFFLFLIVIYAIDPSLDIFISSLFDYHSSAEQLHNEHCSCLAWKHPGSGRVLAINFEIIFIPHHFDHWFLSMYPSVRFCSGDGWLWNTISDTNELKMIKKFTIVLRVGLPFGPKKRPNIPINPRYKSIFQRGFSGLQGSPN